jgi:hypothetical protein
VIHGSLKIIFKSTTSWLLTTTPSQEEIQEAMIAHRNEYDLKSKFGAHSAPGLLSS